jgi:TonB family protein
MLNMRRGFFWSLVLHAVVVLFLSGILGDILPIPDQQVMRVQLVQLPVPKEDKPQPAPAQPQPEKIRTQASAAPKEAPKQPSKPKDKPRADVPKVKVAKKADEPKVTEKPRPKEPEKVAEQEEKKTRRRPPKLDKTPDKTQALRSEDAKAKTVADADDFLAALEFVDKLKDKKPPTPQEESVIEDRAELTLADQADLARLKQHIERNWLVPPGIQGMNRLSLLVEIHVSPDGQVTDLKLKQSSGQPFFDNSLLRAVRKSVPFPIPSEKYDLFKVIELNFNGEGLS